MQNKTVNVAIAIIKKNGKYLVGWRDKQKHQGGCYEFIGGKVEENETPIQALKRECFEEINITITQQTYLKKKIHHYDKVSVVLHIYQVTQFSGKPLPKEGQTLHWVDELELIKLQMPKANDDIKRLALLNPYYFISTQFKPEKWLSSYIEKLPQHALFYVRDYDLSETAYFEVVSELIKVRQDLKIIIHYQHLDIYKAKYQHLNNIVGLHLSSKDTNGDAWQSIDKKWLCIAACHDDLSIKKIQKTRIDAITLSPVKQTQSHPDITPMGVDKFSELVTPINLPVYALGGMQIQDLPEINDKGGFGVAGISMVSGLIENSNQAR